MFGFGQYEFQMIDRRTNTTALRKRYMLKVNGINVQSWHAKFNSKDFIYRLVDTKTGEEVPKSITYKLLKGPNV